ncbi:MAG: ATP-dependent DNA helicase RecG, partial [Clostridiales bacterium]|nr:ATP-dependent DNA helicase RecG [Clostridiales bacterium]
MNTTPILDQSVAALKGIGEKRAQAFQRLRVETWRDLLFFMPREYHDFSREGNVDIVQHGELTILKLRVVEAPRQIRPKGGLHIVNAHAMKESGALQLVWYNQPYRARQVTAGKEYFFAGRVDTSRGKKLVNPAILPALPGILPVYPMAQGLTQQYIRQGVRAVLKAGLPEVTETLPAGMLDEYALYGIREALQGVHFPADMDMLQKARHRLAFEDMLYFLLAVAMFRQDRQGKTGIAFCAADMRAAFLDTLPFTPTRAQLRALQEIEADMQKSTPMNRLVQGDVGSGKTVLAQFALYVAAQSGFQGVFLAPTEILAQQHFALLQKTYGDKACFLSGGLKKAQRAAAYEKIRDGSALVVVGTHALLQADVEFANLGVVITDEQHRFGVRQRAVLSHKSGAAPDMLVMSATPIPRTLTMLLYGDLDLSVLNELPPGRQKVVTRVVPPARRQDMYGFVTKQAAAGLQTFVVCPLIEQSDVIDVKSADEIYKELLTLLPGLRIALLHGRMTAARKDAVMEQFRLGLIDVLVSTTVVEVGVDIPNAAVMVIEGADRFGLAQLHQLRGRVGRGLARSF